MKKNILSALAICAALLGCQKNEISETRPSGVELHATIEDDASTKTVMDENNNIRWSEEDQVVAFMKTSLGLRYQIKKEYIGKTSGYFSQVSSGSSSDIGAGTEWNHNVVYYPYSDAVEAEKSGDDYALNVILPSEQTYAAESFGNGSMAMVAVSEDNNITFKNVLGGMKLQLRGTQKVKSIKLEGKNNEKLAGAATVTAYTDETKPAITMASGASTSVTLDCGSGVQLNESTATEFIIALPPVLFSKGFTVTVKDDAGNEQTIQTDKENSVLRSSLLVMPEVTLNKVTRPGDYIDEYGENHGQGVKIGDTVWAPVNCGYHATDFKYGKLYQWGRKYGQGYSGEFYDGKWGQIYSDASVPELVAGPVSLGIGQSKENANKFYYNSSSPVDWCSPQNDNLWNSGTEENPVKTENDPCPEGWRVPTYAELYELNNNYSSFTTDDSGRSGRWFSGPNSYTASVPQVFFPAAGYRDYNYGRAYDRGYDGGAYWSSRPNGYYGAYILGFYGGLALMSYNYRASGYPVRCVQDNSSESSDQEVELVCALSARDTKSVGLDEFNNMYLVGDDFVDVNGVDYPIKGDGTNVFVVKVPKADSYTVSYPADAVKMNNDGTYSVNIPDEYVGSSYGVFIGKVADESLQCNLEAICGIVKLDVSAYVDWDRMEFESICGSAMWGNAVLLSDYSVHAISEGESIVTVKRSGDDQYMFMPILPASVNGIAVTMYNKAGDILIERRSGIALTFKRGMMYDFGRL